jgi:hypothetical protein
VYGGLHDEEFADPTRAFFARVEQGAFRLLTSPLVLAELRDAPQEVRDSYARLGPWIEATAIDDETLALRDAYLDAGVVTPRWTEDALHVAIATVNGAELIVSWNFRHIVNYDQWISGDRDSHAARGTGI